MISLFAITVLVMLGVLNYKHRAALFYMAVVLVFLIFGFNKQNPDYDAYQRIFETSDENVEFGYKWLVELLKSTGFSSHDSVVFILALFVASFFLCLSGISRLPYILIPLYLTFPGPVDIIQVRNTFSVFAFLYGVVFFFRGRKILSIVFFVTSILFHIFGLIYLATFILGKFMPTRRRGLIVAISATLFLFFLEYGLLPLADSGLTRSLSEYISEDFKKSSVFFWGGMLCADLYFLRWFKCTYIAEDCNEFSTKMLSLMMASLIFVAGLGFIYDFNRLYRLTFLIKLIIGADFFYKSNYKSRIFLVTYLYVTATCIYTYYNYYIDIDCIYLGFWLCNEVR